MHKLVKWKKFHGCRTNLQSSDLHRQVATYNSLMFIYFFQFPQVGAREEKTLELLTVTECQSTWSW